MICGTCGNEFEPRPGPGRPRKHCYSCKPFRDRMHPDRIAMEKRARERAATEQKERAAAARADLLARHGICRCGRDYLTVPLDEAHLCPSPGLIPADVAAYLQVTRRGYPLYP